MLQKKIDIYRTKKREKPVIDTFFRAILGP